MFTLIQLLKLIVMSGDMDQCVTIVGHELLFFAFVDNELYFFDQNKYVCQRVRLKDLCRLKPQLELRIDDLQLPMDELLTPSPYHPYFDVLA